MAHLIARTTLILIALLIPSLAMAQQNDFPLWLQQLQIEAISAGISPETVHTALDNAMTDDRVVELDQKQPEHTVMFDDYVRRVISDQRVEMGRQLLEDNMPTLEAIANQYHVQPEFIVALWAVESSFGQITGRYSIVDSLVTLAYEGRRAQYFRNELLQALRIIDQERIHPSSLRGSWAGAMGQCQFMPTTYLNYAVDYDGDGRRDIWENRPDVWASIANYIAAEGWTDSQTWGREVRLKKRISEKKVGLKFKQSLSKWAAAGIRSRDGSPLPQKPLQASLIQPDGPDGRSFLVYDNYRALMRWNRSTYFATAVGLLADRIK